MVSPLIYGVAAVVVVLAALFLLPMLLNRGKWLKCPDCGEVFKAPALDQKSSGLGFNPPGLGKVQCPKCGQTRARRDYQKASPPDQPRAT